MSRNLSELFCSSGGVYPIEMPPGGVAASSCLVSKPVVCIIGHFVACIIVLIPKGGPNKPQQLQILLRLYPGRLALGIVVLDCDRLAPSSPRLMGDEIDFKISPKGCNDNSPASVTSFAIG